MAHLFATRPDELRACLSSELDRWKENAERIVLTNQTALFLGFVEATTDALFGELPGPSLTTQLVTDLVIDVAAAVLEQVYAPGLLGNLAASLAGLAADAWFHAEAKEDLDETRAVFKQHLMSQIEIVRERILRDLSRLNPLYAFRLEWLAGADASELTDFTIPFTPRDTSQAQWTGSFRNGYIRVSEKHRAR